MRTVAALGLLSWTVACASMLLAKHSAGAPGCPDSNPNWVRVTVDASQNEQLVYKLMERLQAELAPYRIRVCPNRDSGPPSPLAEIHIVHSSSKLVAIEVEVEDSVTQKRVARDLDLRGIPEDAQALTIALGAAELLRASWAEIKLRRADIQRANVPSGVTRAVDEDLTEPAARAVLGLRGTGEEFARGLRQAGVDAIGAFPIYGPWQIMFRMGARQAFPVQARDGSIRASSWLVGTGAALRLTPPAANAYVGLAGHLDWVRMQFIGEPQPGALAMAQAGTGFLTSLGVLGAVKVSSSAQFETEFDAGAVTKGVSARDAGREVVAMNGPWVAVSLGIGVLIR